MSVFMTSSNFGVNLTQRLFNFQFIAEFMYNLLNVTHSQKHFVGSR